LEWTLPEPNDVKKNFPQVKMYYEFLDDLEDNVAVLQGFKPQKSTRHRLLGHPQLIQGLGIGEQTQLLLQIDSDFYSDVSVKNGMMWGDVGMVYFFIDQTDLAKFNFGSAWSEMNCF
jgi:uncharacterized protein YwqG